MSASDDTTDAPGLAEEIAKRLASEQFLSSDAPEDVNVTAEVIHEMIQPILRAVEAVRAFPRKTESRWTATSPYGNGYVNGYRDAVEAVQALLEGEQ